MVLTKLLEFRVCFFCIVGIQQGLDLCRYSILHPVDLMRILSADACFSHQDTSMKPGQGLSVQWEIQFSSLILLDLTQLHSA